MSEFARDPQTTASTVAAPPEEPAVPMPPTALVDDRPVLPPGMATTLPPAPTGTGGQGSSGLLTPEERQKVIDELEALARSQQVKPPG